MRTRNTTVATLVLAAISAGVCCAAPPIALDGYCPMFLMHKDKLFEGEARYSMVYDGKTYLLSGPPVLQIFARTPAKIIPALGGDCVVSFADRGERVPGSPGIRTYYGDRVYLFPTEELKQRFINEAGRYANADLAVGGKCPVGLVRQDRVEDGLRKFSAMRDGRLYLLAGKRKLQAFEKKAARFIPAWGGNCTVTKTDSGTLVAGRAEFHATHEDRLYLFASQEHLDKFKADPAKYANADVALAGRCPVCKVDAAKDVEGKADIVLDHHSHRYHFDSPEHLDAFVADPMKYAAE